MTQHKEGLEAPATAATLSEESVVTERMDVLPATVAGVRALVGVAVAIVGVLAAVNPDSVFLRALNQAMPQLADAIPTLITACGAVLAAFSQPPKFRRRG